MRWTVLLPVKALPAAKSRLIPASSGPDEHRRLVTAIRTDTAAAAGGAANVARVLLVLDRPDDPGFAPTAPRYVQVATGLNAALGEAAEHAASTWPGDGIAALVGDLPALRADELADALGAAYRRAFVADAAGTGTTLLIAAPGVALRPRFGAGSAARHAADGAAALAAGPGLRNDVDTAADLAIALELGVGPATRAVVAPGSFTLARHDGPHDG